MKSIKLLKPQPSPRSGRSPLTNITNMTNYFHSHPKQDKQTYRSPSHSPRNTNRSNYFDKQQKKYPLSRQPLQVRQLNRKCINHKERNARFMVQGENLMSVYCEHCAFQLSQKGNKVVVIKNQEKGSQMITEAKQFIRASDNVIVSLNDKLDALNYQKNRVQKKYSKIIQQIQQQRREIIKKVNDNYDRQKCQQEQFQKTLIQKLNQEQSFFRNMYRQFETLKKDVKQNINQINYNIQLIEFREIMDIYWQKINKFNEANLKPIINNITQSSQAFVNKYLPPDSHSKNKTIQQVIRGQYKNQGKEFTFSKKFWGLQSKARQTYSYQNSWPVTESNQSIILQKFRLL